MRTAPLHFIKWQQGTVPIKDYQDLLALLSETEEDERKTQGDESTTTHSSSVVRLIGSRVLYLQRIKKPNFIQVKTILSHFISIAAILLLFFSCQKEVSFDNGQVAGGELEKDINNNCLPPIINGNYIAGKNLDGNNSIDAQVHVTNAGTYSINSDTVNGYSFNATGSFKDTGLVIVKLAGRGKPIAPGSNQFQIIYGTSSCDVRVTVLSSSNTASFTLRGAPGLCMKDSIIGSYVRGSALDTGNHVLISVDVTVPGTYTISTGVVNGYSFSSSGSFASIGVQTIDLTASGLPINAGTDIFTVNTGSSSCSFSIAVLTAVTTTNNDLFPLTMGSY